MFFQLKTAAILTAAVLTAGTAMASGGASGPAVNFAVQGNIGEVVVNPYDVAPLTAVIRNGGYELKDVEVRIVPKLNGQEIKYKVSDRQLKTNAGIPVFGLYPDYINTVEVKYTRLHAGKAETFKESYQFYAPPVYTRSNGTRNQKGTMFDTEVIKVHPDFKDRLYLVGNQLSPIAPHGAHFVWNNPMGGALEWAFNSQIGIIDTAGDVRGYLLDDKLSDPKDPWSSGYMMGFQQTKDGALTWGFGQRYVKYDLMGRKIFNRLLPPQYSDFSHAFDNAQNGHSFLRVANADYRRPDGKRVHTVRDVIVELDENGGVVDDFRLYDILDPYRDNVVKAMDQGAVCLNIDEAKAGHTLSAEELAKMDENSQFGDIAGVGPGRNWAHVNSVDYDPTDDSIIISSRHQGIVKIGRDKKVKWILASPEGWKKGLKETLLTPVDKNGKPIKCEGSKCEGDFDWSWTQHTAWRIDSKSDKNILYLSVFDNGDARGMEQPPLPDMKYSRAVVYKIDQKKKTVEQIWEVGKELGHPYFCPVTGLTKYMEDKDTMMVYWSTAGLGATPEKAGNKLGRVMPHICEYRWGETTPVVDIKLNDTFGYQAFPISVDLAFTKN
ncbi:MAG: aryl-sulfate sulfotransferase [Sutterella wadsworthensis]|nr:aryl-sulfate sulfotransferase [Sutterella wadsworthensis]